MKTLIICVIIFFNTSFILKPSLKIQIIKDQPVKNLFIVTIDGLRWQEIFNGADPEIINDLKFTQDTALTKAMYWATTKKERRQKLLPFFWNVIAAKGSLYGNRKYHNNVNVPNIYNFSYPGYNEILTGNCGLKTIQMTKRIIPI